MRIGLSCHHFPGAESAPAHRTVELAAAHGLDGVAFASVIDASPQLDHGELRELRECADSLGVYLEIGIGRIAGARETTPLGELTSLIEACHVADCTEVTGYTTLDRSDTAMPFGAQLNAVIDTVRAVEPQLRDLDCRLNLETHEDLATADVLHIVTAFEPAAVGVNLDIANPVIRGHDPLAATQRLAPFVHQTQLEDFVLLWSDLGLLRRRLVPCGDGAIDWAAVLSVLRRHTPDLTLSLELHRAQFEIPLLDPSWLALNPTLTAEDVASLVRLANERQRDQPTIPAYSADPARAIDGLMTSLDHLRRVVAELDQLEVIGQPDIRLGLGVA